MVKALKNLFSQTLLYGLSSVLGRFLNYLLTPVLTAVLSVAANGKIATIYALIAFFNIIFSLGMESAYFRYAALYPEKKIFSAAAGIILIVTFIGGGLLTGAAPYWDSCLELGSQGKYVFLAAGILCLDNIVVLPLARLRFYNKPLRFVGIRLAGIGVNVAGALFFLLFLPSLSPDYEGYATLEYVLWANLSASALVALLLLPQWRGFTLVYNKTLCRELVQYALPLVVVGLAGMINETLDRIMLPKLAAGSLEERYVQNGIYSANYKLSMLITLFIQAFRMGSEPFFFKTAKDKAAKELYAQVLLYFVLFCLSGFLGIVLFLDFWKYFINAHRNAAFASGLSVVPILLSAHICLGIYYNLSIAYKLTDKTKIGAYISLAGALVSVLGNVLFIPVYGFQACAWVTLFCYATMMVLAYGASCKYYPIRYPVKKIGFYVFIAYALWALSCYWRARIHTLWGVGLCGTLSWLLFLVIIYKKEALTLRAFWRVQGKDG